MTLYLRFRSKTDDQSFAYGCAPQSLKKYLYTALLGLLFLIPGKGWGQYSITSGSTNYTQNFNTLTAGTWANNTTLSGWYARTTATTSITAYASNIGNTTTAGLYAYGVSGANPVSDRALGYMTTNGYTGAAGSGMNFLGWRLKNNTGAKITVITITWTGEQWRRENNAAQQNLNLSYQKGATVTDLIAGTWISASSSFTSPISGAIVAALDGNLPSNRTANITATITIDIEDGEEIMLRWDDLNDSGNDHALAIDDVTVNAMVVATCNKPATPTGMITGTTPSCNSSVLTYTHGATQPESGIDYYWQTSATGTDTSNNANATYTANASGTYYIRGRTATDCWSDASAGYDVVVNIGPSISVHPSTTDLEVCNGTNFSPNTLSVTATGTNITYQWYRNTAPTNTGGTPATGTGANTATYIVPNNIVGDSYYYCVVTGISPCSAVATSNVSGKRTVNALPTQPTGLQSNSPQCAPGGVTISYTGTPETNVAWYWQGTANNGTSTSNSNATFNATATGTYYIRPQNTITGCWGPQASIAVVINPQLSGSASSPSPSNNNNNVCYSGNGAINQIYWSSVTNATSYDVYFGAGSLPTTVTANVATNSYTVGTLLPSTTYYWKIVPRNACGETTGTVNTWNFTTQSSPCYCIPVFSSSSDFIVNFDLESIINNTGYSPNGYGNFTHLSTDLEESSNYNVNIRSSAGSGNHGVAVWIDLNDNLVFENSERVGIGPNNIGANANVSIPITIPSGNIGSHRLRIIYQYNVNSTNIDPCASASYGEAEDYTVNIVAACTPPSGPTGSITASGTNPSCDPIILTYTGSDSGVAYWQTSATGTSLAEPISTTIKTITTSGTHYVRIYSGDCWSTNAISYNVTIDDATLITTQPQNQSVTQGSQATFNVTAVGGDLTYQWQVSTDGGANWGNVTNGTGGNTSSYTTLSATEEMDGNKYRVIINGSCGNITSDGNATLSVVEIVINDGDFMTKTGGTWTNNATGTVIWYKREGGAWVEQPTGTTPSGTSGFYTVFITENTTVPAAGPSIFNTGKVHVLNNATLQFANTGSNWIFKGLTIGDGASVHMTGRFRVENNFTIKNGGNFIYDYAANGFNGQTTYIFAGAENFEPNSNFVVKSLNGGNFLEAAVLNAITVNSENSYFGNIIVDYSSGSGTLSVFSSNPQTSAAFANTICNDMIFRSSNGSLRFYHYSTLTGIIGSSSPIKIGGNFITESTFTNSINFMTANIGGTLTLNVAKDFILNSGTFYNVNSSTTSNLFNLNIGGNMTLLGASKYAFRSNIASTATHSVNLSGNLSVALGASFTDEGTNTTTTGNIYFVNTTSPQTIDVANQATNIKVNYAVRNGANVSLINHNLSLGNSSEFRVLTGGTFNFGFNDAGTALNVMKASVATGTSFTQQPDSDLYITSPDGIQASGALGNVQTDTRTFATASPYADYHFIGKDPQVTGTAFPDNVRDLTIQNTSAANEVTLTNTAASFTVSRSLDVQSGIFNLNDKNVSGVSAATLNIEGLSTFKLSGDKTFPLGFGSIVFKPTSIVEYGGTTQTVANSTISGYLNLPAYQTLKVSGNGVKTATGTTVVNEMTVLSSNAATLLVPEYIESAVTPVYSVFNAKRGIHNTNGTTGDFIVGNDAVLMQDLDADNSQGYIKARKKHSYKTDNSRKEYNFLSSPVADQNMKLIFGNNPANIPFVTKLNEPTNVFVNAVTADWALAGKGFAVKEPKYTGYVILGDGLADDTAQYKGRPNNGNLVDLPLSYTTGRGYNLAGNPYPSNIDIVELYANSVNYSDPDDDTSVDIDPTFRFWDNKVNDIYIQMGGSYKGYSYATFNVKNDTDGFGVAAPGRPSGPTAEETVPTNIIKMSQAFMVRAKREGAALKYSNSLRRTGFTDTVFFGKSPDKNRYRLQLVKSDGLTFQNGISYFAEGKTDFGLEDSKIGDASASDALFTFAGDAKVVINGRSGFSENDVVTLGLRHFTAGTYKIQTVDRQGVFANGQTVYLKDKQLGILTDLSSGDYTFTSEAGEFTNRFEIVYRPATTLGTAHATGLGIEIYREGSSFVIRSSGEKITNAELYDAAGRLLLRMGANTREVRFEADRLADGMYVVKTLMSNGESLSKKIRK